MNCIEWIKPGRRGSRTVVLLGLLLASRTNGAFALQAPPPASCQALQHSAHFPLPESYGVTLVRNPVRHKPELTTRRDRLFRTTIREAAAGDIDFAGHYAIAKWGCGTGCLGFVVVDVLTGKVYDPAFPEVDFHYPTTDDAPTWTCFPDMVTHRATSRLLVVEGCPAGALCGRHFFVMRNGGLREILYDPDQPETAPPASKTPAGKNVR